jgi:hypothetical protein
MFGAALLCPILSLRAGILVSCRVRDPWSGVCPLSKRQRSGGDSVAAVRPTASVDSDRMVFMIVPPWVLHKGSLRAVVIGEVCSVSHVKTLLGLTLSLRMPPEMMAAAAGKAFHQAAAGKRKGRCDGGAR